VELSDKSVNWSHSTYCRG